MAVPALPMVHDITLVTTKKLARARVMGVPPEEFGIERNARSVETSNYCYHEVVTKTEADLVAEGYDKEQVKSLESYGIPQNYEQVARDSIYETQGVGAEQSASRLVRVTEHYIRLDYEGTGRACLYQIVTGGEQGEILKKGGKECIEPFDVMPFACTTPVPVPHRFFGRSIADLVMDIQRIKTALVRGGLDNLYLHNNPRPEIAESHAGPNTIDDILTVRPGAPIRTKQPGGLVWQNVPDITPSLFPALEYWDSTREMRTGVTRVGQGVDANALVNETATKANQVFTMAQARMKLIARVMAEGVKDIFSLLHWTIRRHGQQAQTVRLRNQWVHVDPRNWKTREDMTIHVGLGTGGKAEQFAQTMALANVQKELVMAGKTNLVDDAKLFNTASELAKIMGHKNPDKFFNDPSAVDQQTGQPKYPPPPAPVPEAVQVAQVKAQTDQQNMAVQAQLDERADNRKAQIESVQAEADIATQNRKTEAEMIKNQQKFELDKELALLDFELQRQLKMAELEMKREMHQQTLAQNAEQHRQQMEAGVFKVAASAEQHDQKMEQMKNAPKPKGGK
jgi:hypothetical protein